MMCTHKTIKDFCANGVWKCCDCGAEGSWVDGWTYYGNIECSKCWTASIEKVMCPKCAPKQRKEPKG